jgi:hypothetical protein
MTTPIFWTDPKAGAAYAMRERLTSAQKNAHVTALHNFGMVFEKMMAHNWIHTATPSGLNTKAYSAAYSSVLGMWAIAGQHSSAPAIVTSPDGHVWTTPTVPASTATYLNCIAAQTTQGYLVAGADDGTVRRSVDGSTWTEYATGITGIITHVFYDDANALFHAMEAGRGVARAVTGSSWTYNASALPSAFSGATFVRGCHGNSLDVITGSTLSVCATSTDGITWTQRNMPASGAWGSGLCYAAGLGKFVATDNTTAGKIAHSTDGINWTAVTGATRPTGTTLSMVQSSGNVLLARGSFTLLMMSDDEGAHWECVGEAPSIISDVRYGEGDGASDVGGRYVAVGVSATASGQVIVGLRVQL